MKDKHAVSRRAGMEWLLDSGMIRVDQSRREKYAWGGFRPMGPEGEKEGM